MSYGKWTESGPAGRIILMCGRFTLTKEMREVAAWGKPGGVRRQAERLPYKRKAAARTAPGPGALQCGCGIIRRCFWVDRGIVL